MDKGDKKGLQFENDIFAIAMEAFEDKKDNTSIEKTAIVVGEKGCGKTTVIATLAGEEAKAERKPTAGMDYKFSIKKAESSKIVGNFHEIGGGRLMSDLLKTALNPKKLSSTVLIICIDMSQPDTALIHLNFWISKAVEAVNKAYEELANSDPELANGIRESAAFKWEGHVDARRVTPIAIPTIIVGTKYDVFGLQESENRKWLCRALRYNAHYYGCDLTFSSYREKDFDSLKLIINKHIFGSQKDPKSQTDHGKILCIMEGQDKMTAIGDPPVPGEMAIEQAWLMSIQNYFPLKNPVSTEEVDDKELGDISRYADAKIDAMKAQKDEEIARNEQYNKKQQAKKVKKAN
jgi:dynein light intermediate chain 2